MTLESHACIGRRHTRAVVDYLNERAACIFEDYRYRGRSGIDGVLYKFFDYRRRTLYDFSGSNLVGHRVG